jgi:hypothetical protein
MTFCHRLTNYLFRAVKILIKLDLVRYIRYTYNVATIDATLGGEEKMTLAAALLRAPRIGAREFRNKACSFIRRGKAYLVTEHGQPAGVFLPYEDAIELADIMLKIIAEGRRAISRGTRGISLLDSLKKRGKSV